MRRECPKRSTATTMYPPNLGKLSLCSEKGILATCTSTCIGANKHCAKSLLYDSVYLCVYLRNAQNITCVVYLKCTTAYI